MQRAVAALLLALASVGAAWGADETRSFRLQFRSVHDAVAFLDPVLSPRGIITLKPKQGTLVITDSPAVIARVAEALAAWDVPSVKYRVRINVLLAHKEPGKAAEPPSSVDPKVLEDVNKLFPYYRSFEELDTLKVSAAEGSAIESTAGGKFLLRFSLRAVATDRNAVLLQPFEVVRVGLPGGLPSPTLDRSTVSLPFGQTQVIFVSAGAGSLNALMLVFLAEPEQGK